MKKILFYFALVSMTILTFSCKETTDVGYDILPDKDKLKLIITDTATIKVHTYSMDTIAVDKVPSVLLGQYSDPHFGPSSSGFAMQFTMPTYPNFEDSTIADSVVITLPYTSADTKSYGDTMIQQSIEIYELSTLLSPDSTYYSTQNPDEIHSGDLLGTYTFTPIPYTDSLRVYETDTTYMIPNYAKITLGQDIAERFTAAESSVYESVDSFKEFFKGIYLKSTGGDAIIKYDVNENTIFTVYYHYPASETEALSWSASANSSSCVRLNLFEHDYSQTSFFNQLDDDSLPEDSVAYIQAMGGLRVKVDFPNIVDFNAFGDFSIYRAELIIQTANEEFTLENTYPAAQRMVMTGVGTDSEYYLIPEYVSESQYISVAYSDDNEYSFDLADHVKNLIEGNVENNGFYIFSSAGSFSLGRSIITTGSANRNMKLVITYTKLD